MDRIRAALEAAYPSGLLEAVDAIGLVWWKVNAGGDVVVSDGPGLYLIDRMPHELVGSNLFADWPDWATRSPVLEVRQVLEGRASGLTCSYVMGGREWVATIRTAVVQGGRGALVVTHPRPRQRGAGDGKAVVGRR